MPQQAELDRIYQEYWVSFLNSKYAATHTFPTIQFIFVLILSKIRLRTMRLSDIKTLYNNNVYLFIGLVALLIQIVSYVLFEINAESSLSIKTIILDQLQKVPVAHVTTLEEYKARILWLSSSVISITAFVIALVWSVVIIYRCRQKQHVYKIISFGIAICGLNLWRICTANEQSAMYNNIFSTTYEALAALPFISAALLSKVFAVIVTINIFAAITPVVILMAICSAITLVSEHSERTLAFFTQRVIYLEQGIIIGSMIMLFGIIHMAAWTQWPIAILEDSPLKKSFLTSLSAIYQFWGVAFSLLLFSLYSTAMIYWRGQVRLVLQHSHPDINAKIWLLKNGFNFSWQKQIPQISAMLTPLLAGLSSSGTNLMSLH
jgi:hypothetical protein